MATRPELIFADEPTGNLDSRSATELLELTRVAVETFGQTVVMVTHDPMAASYADRVVLLADGRIVHEAMGPTVAEILDALKGLGS
jgi:putative ABC transport system ATP-binding protein